MSWLGAVVGGAFGFLLGGPLGAIFGASAGHQFDKGLTGIASNEALHHEDQQRVQMAFFTATFSVMGHIAKADGRVTPEEISLANRIMDEMALINDMRTAAINLFQQGKKADFPLAAVLAQFYKECYRRPDLLSMFVKIQLQAAFADGVLDNNEEKLLLHICSQLRISRFDYQRLKIQVQAQYRFNRQSSSHHKPREKKSSLQDAYGVLGLTPSASKAEVKKAYRRLMSQNHPDKLVAKGLPEEIMRVAKEKTQKISKAYEVIQKAE
jgi:DnaJ like chaperone protein